MMVKVGFKTDAVKALRHLLHPSQATNLLQFMRLNESGFLEGFMPMENFSFSLFGMKASDFTTIRTDANFIFNDFEKVLRSSAMEGATKIMQEQRELRRAEEEMNVLGWEMLEEPDKMASSSKPKDPATTQQKPKPVGQSKPATTKQTKPPTAEKPKATAMTRPHSATKIQKPEGKIASSKKKPKSSEPEAKAKSQSSPKPQEKGEKGETRKRKSLDEKKVKEKRKRGTEQVLKSSAVPETKSAPQDPDKVSIQTTKATIPAKVKSKRSAQKPKRKSQTPPSSPEKTSTPPTSPEKTPTPPSSPDKAPQNDPPSQFQDEPEVPIDTEGQGETTDAEASDEEGYRHDKGRQGGTIRTVTEMTSSEEEYPIVKQTGPMTFASSEDSEEASGGEEQEMSDGKEDSEGEENEEEERNEEREEEGEDSDGDADDDDDDDLELSGSEQEMDD